MKLSLPLKENHEALWNWLAENPDKGKCRWPGKMTIAKYDIPLPRDLHFITQTCFACQATPVKNGLFDCTKCPVKWGAKKCTDARSLYKKWCQAVDPEERTKYARLIAKGWKR